MLYAIRDDAIDSIYECMISWNFLVKGFELNPM